jgi:hypothetical protein
MKIPQTPISNWSPAILSVSLWPRWGAGGPRPWRPSLSDGVGRRGLLYVRSRACELVSARTVVFWPSWQRVCESYLHACYIYKKYQRAYKMQFTRCIFWLISPLIFSPVVLSYTSRKTFQYVPRVLADRTPRTLLPPFPRR